MVTNSIQHCWLWVDDIYEVLLSSIQCMLTLAGWAHNSNICRIIFKGEMGYYDDLINQLMDEIEVDCTAN